MHGMFRRNVALVGGIDLNIGIATLQPALVPCLHMQDEPNLFLKSSLFSMHASQAIRTWSCPLSLQVPPRQAETHWEGSPYSSRCVQGHQGTDLPQPESLFEKV